MRTALPRPAAIAAALLAALVALVAAARAEVPIREVRSGSGVTAWLVEDYSVPIIAVRFAFRGGSTQDPRGKEGLARLMSGLFDEGAGELDRAAFLDRLDRSGAEMSFSAGQDALHGAMRMLAEDRDAAFGLLALAVQRPRFDAGPVDRIRAQLVAGIEARARDPETEAELAWAAAIWGDHPYARPDEGTAESLAMIGAADLAGFHRRMFARDNLVVGVVGAIDAATLSRELDRVFGALPERPVLDPVPPVEPRLDQSIALDFDLPQATIRLAYPGIARSDPDFFAAYLVNHVLGGGTFSSRLFSEVRERRGLAYGVGSSLVNRRHASALVIGTSTRPDRAAETLAIIRAEVARMAREGPTEEELAAAKAYVVGAYPIANLGSSGAIARTLVDMQVEGLGMDYMERREDIIRAVTIEDARRVAARLLSVEPAVMLVGARAGAGAD